MVLCFSVEIDDGVDFLWVEDNSCEGLGGRLCVGSLRGILHRSIELQVFLCEI